MTDRMSITEVNALDRETFVARFGGVFEHSPWVAEAAWDARPFASAEALLDAMLRTVLVAPEERQMALIRAHPDLGARMAMSESSVREQQGAGLDRLTGAESAELASLNRIYAEKFGFPFIMAVRGKTKAEIIAGLKERIGRSAGAERSEALRQIGRIAAFRLADLFAEDAGEAASEAVGAIGVSAVNIGQAVPAGGKSGIRDAGGKAGRLTTHVLDVMRGRPAAGMRIGLYRLEGGSGTRTHLADARTNADGRTDAPLLEGEALQAGVYELVFHAGDYFRAAAADIGFLDEVPVRFRIADPSAHYHVPLLAAPGGYSTYRGSQEAEG